jgi:hypothetical protein
MRERIFLTYTNASSLPYHGAILGHHVVLNYIDANGYHHTLEGVPEHRFDRNAGKFVAFLREEGMSDGVRNTDSPFRRLKIRQGRGVGEDALDKQHTMIASGDDLSSEWDRMKRFGESTDATGYEYRPLSQNSNSFAAGALQQAGLLGPGTALPEAFDWLVAVDRANKNPYTVRVPGFDQRLQNPLNLAVPPLDAVPFVSTNSPVASDRHAPFDTRFENGNSSLQRNRVESNGHLNWLPAIGNRGVTKPRSERYLTRRLTDGTEVSAFDTGAPAVPFVPSDENSMSDGSASFVDRFGNWSSAAPVHAPRAAYSLSPSPAEAPPGIVAGQPNPDLPFPVPFLNLSKSPSGRDETMDNFLFGLLRFRR